MTPKENLAAIKAALRKAGNTRFVARELPGLNHLFQTAATGLVTEYGQIEQTLAPVVLQQVGDWILSVAATASGHADQMRSVFSASGSRLIRATAWTSSNARHAFSACCSLKYSKGAPSGMPLG